MGLILGWLFSIVGWIFAGIWTWNWIEPDSFGRTILWLIVFSIVSFILRVIFGLVGAAIGSLFD